MRHVLIDTLKKIVGDNAWCTDQVALEPHLTEWRGAYRGKTPIMVSPGTTEEVSGVVKACAAAGAPMVVQGGNTGLCGGAVPDASGTQVLVSMSRMNRVREVSAGDYSLVAEAGCILADLQQAAAAAGRLFALSLAAEGSCQIGGNLSTNAGGINVLKYGTARDQVLGLEVVLPNGDVWNGLRRLRKDTAGYDVKQLFIGAEGTLGVVTAASLKLYPLPENPQVALVAAATAQAAVDLFAELRVRLADRLLAFELISARAMRYVLKHIPNTRQVLDERHPWYVLLEAAAPGGERSIEETLAASIEGGTALDAALAKSEAEQHALWRLRHSISEAQKLEGASLKHDVSVPVGDVGRFIEAAEAAVTKAVPGTRVVAFGHVGDGNVHFNLSQPKAMQPDAFIALRDSLARVVYDIVAEFGGSISAEHGIGALKREPLLRYLSTTEIAIMRAVKRALDPDNLMNPGKVL